MRVVELLAAMAVIVPTAATAQVETAPSVASDQAEKPSRNRMICKSLGQTGSRIAKRRVCATAAEWEERSAIDRAMIDEMSRNTVPNSPF